MKIKEDLVYNKNKGKLIEYVILGNVEKQLLLMEQNKKVTDYVATHMLAFMVRGLHTGLNYPLAHFTTANLSGEPVWRTNVPSDLGGHRQIGDHWLEGKTEHSVKYTRIPWGAT